MTTLAELAVVVRSGFTESRHHGTLVALAADGTRVLALGEPDAPLLPRSSLKPLQALACLRAGARLEGPALAIAAGSHTGEDRHVELVRGMLDGAGLPEDALQCPADRPEDEATFAALLRAGAEPRTRVRMNCSGKHAAMLLACLANGWPTQHHLAADHPLQQLVRATVEEVTGSPVTYVAVDGCGAPLFGTTARGLAEAFHALALADPGTDTGTVAAAMREHPDLVGGTGHPNTGVMTALPGTLAKGGAEGVIGVAAPDGTTVAMKVADGSPRATTMLALAVLAGLGVDVGGADGEPWTHPEVLGGGVPVGGIEVGADLADALARAGAASAGVTPR